MISRRRAVHLGTATAVAALAAGASLPAAAAPERWRAQWPSTDFSKRAVPFEEIHEGGPPKDGIPAIDAPLFVASDGAHALVDRDPVVSLSIDGEARAYPVRVLIWHEIVNDRIGGTDVSVTYCPLCNTAIAFDGSIDGRVLSFGVTGKLRHSDMLMYDRQTESWWQQASGEAVVGAMTGTVLRQLPARLESFAAFRARHPEGRVLVPGDPAGRPYGHTPYAGYEDSGWPFLYRGRPLDGITALERVVVVGSRAWTVDLLKVRGVVEDGDLRLEWTPGQASPFDTPEIAAGRDVGNVVVRRRVDGGWRDVPHLVTFAFLLDAMRPNAVIHTLSGDLRWTPG